MNILSLFDGISCGQVALNRAGIKYDNYFASEIDKNSIQVTQKRFPETTQIGDVLNVSTDSLPKIDLLMGGSPCQGFSWAGKRLNFDDPRSKLFFEFYRILEGVNPKYFLLENVNMKKESQQVITNHLGVDPVFINSADFSAQERKRLYWTNIPFDKMWGKDTSTLEDILEEEVDDYYYVEPQRTVQIIEKEIEKLAKRRKVGYIEYDSQANRIYSIYGKSVCLCGEAGGLGAKTGLYAIPCLTPDRLIKRQNGRRFKPPFSKFYTLTTIDRHGVLIGNYIRKLTPLECERLQTLPDNYTEDFSPNQRYKMIGNGWTVDAIVHILKGLRNMHS